MGPDEILELTAKLVAIRSPSGKERDATTFVADYLRRLDWPVEELNVPGNDAKNLFVAFGTPKIIFTTHLDIVPAPDAMFQPRFEGSRLYGRGSCDAKGIAATMIAAVKALRSAGKADFGLLFVVCEETDGSGAKAAAETLKGRGIRYVVNGEPTEAMLASAHRGLFLARLTVKGKPAHSGYPELGVDANATLIRILAELIEAPLGDDPLMGKATLNPGLINGGVASNVVSPSATASIGIRTVNDAAEVRKKVSAIIAGRAEMEIVAEVSPTVLTTLPGFETTTVKYMTDIPHFFPLGAEYLLYGPGSIHVAHTDHEYVEREQIAKTFEGYQKIYQQLQELL